MAVAEFDLNDVKRRMQGAVASFKHDINSLRTGRASANLLDPIQVEAYGARIRESDLGLNPQTEGQVIRLRIPEMTEQRRKEMVKVAHKYAEDARVSVRHVRRDGIDVIKKLEKDGHLPKDDALRNSEQVQKATDQTIQEIELALSSKEKEIMQV
jgi:ribosome recycling factor